MIDLSSGPFRTLGIPPSATEAEIRQAYLELVRQYPPDKNPDRFHEIHRAYQTVLSPISQAQQIIEACSVKPDLEATIASASRNMAPLPHIALLALGDEQ